MNKKIILSLAVLAFMFFSINMLQASEYTVEESGTLNYRIKGTGISYEILKAIFDQHFATYVTESGGKKIITGTNLKAAMRNWASSAYTDYTNAYAGIYLSKSSASMMAATIGISLKSYPQPGVDCGDLDDDGNGKYSAKEYYICLFGKLATEANNLKEKIAAKEKYNTVAVFNNSINVKVSGLTIYKDFDSHETDYLDDIYNAHLKNIRNIVTAYQYLYNADTTGDITVGGGSVPIDPDAKCGDDWWGCAFDFMTTGRVVASATAGPVNSAALNKIKEMIFYIGNIIFIVVTAFLGVKYIWGGADSKFSVKNSLVTLIVAAIVFYGWNAVETILNVEGLLTSEAGSGYENMVMKIYNTIIYLVNVAAIGGIIYLGVKYMMAGADGKAEMKVKLIPVVMGIIMVYGTVNLINFILDITIYAI